jgi:hypothetical protein
MRNSQRAVGRLLGAIVIPMIVAAIWEKLAGRRLAMLKRRRKRSSSSTDRGAVLTLRTRRSFWRSRRRLVVD